MALNADSYQCLITFRIPWLTAVKPITPTTLKSSKTKFQEIGHVIGNTMTWPMSEQTSNLLKEKSS